MSDLQSRVWPVGQQNSQTQRKGRYLPDSMAHPGKMLPEIARHAIEAYTKPGDIVIDPMCGIGTTLVEAIHLGRDAYGVELEQGWTDLANRNVSFATTQGATGAAIALCGDGRQIASLLPEEVVGRVDLVITSPPYGRSLHGHVKTGESAVTRTNNIYAKNSANLGSVSTPDLLDAFERMLIGCKELLRPGGKVVVTTRPFRHHGELVDLPALAIEVGRAAGLTPVGRDIALLCARQQIGLVSRASFFQLDYVRRSRALGIPLSVIAHEDVLAFEKEA